MNLTGVGHYLPGHAPLAHQAALYTVPVRAQPGHCTQITKPGVLSLVLVQLIFFFFLTWEWGMPSVFTQHLSSPGSSRVFEMQSIDSVIQHIGSP